MPRVCNEQRPICLWRTCLTSALFPFQDFQGSPFWGLKNIEVNLWNFQEASPGGQVVKLFFEEVWSFLPDHRLFGWKRGLFAVPAVCLRWFATFSLTKRPFRICWFVDLFKSKSKQIVAFFSAFFCWIQRCQCCALGQIHRILPFWVRPCHDLGGLFCWSSSWFIVKIVTVTCLYTYIHLRKSYYLIL